MGRVWLYPSEPPYVAMGTGEGENVVGDVHRLRKGGARQRISPSKASKASRPPQEP